MFFAQFGSPMTVKRVFLISALALAIFVAVSLLDLNRPISYVRLNNLCRDTITRSGKTTPANPNLVFLAIDAASVSLDESDIDEMFGLTGDKSADSQALRLMSKRFPWSRQVYALILEKLVKAGAKVVAFDLNFPGPTDEDAVFQAALDRYADHVIIGSNFVDGSLIRPTDTLVPQTTPSDSRVGFTNFWADDDDVVRQARYRVTFAQVRGVEARPDSERFLSLAAGSLIKAGFAKDVPSDPENHTLRFTAGPRVGFPPHSLFEIFVPSFWEQNYQNGEFFRDKIVLVGADGNWQHDEHPTPFGNMPGSELHLNAMNAAIHHEFLSELTPVSTISLTALAGIISVFASLLIRSPWSRFVFLFLFCLGAVGASLFSFNHFSLYLPVLGPINQAGATMLFGLVCDFTTERFEKTRVRRALERYVSRDVVREMVDRRHLYADSLGGVTKPVAILFSDIRSYSAVTAQSSPQTLVAQLNEYFTAMVECVFQFGGTLDKFIGDAVMAVWGSLRSQSPREDAVAAVNAALAMQEKIVELNRRWRERGWPELRVGTAVNCGEVVVGNIGSPQRMEFTVIGDAVNISWKLQELTKKVSSKLLVSRSVATLVAEHFELQSLGEVSIDKSHLPCEIFTIERPISVFDASAPAVVQGK